ncbi:LysR family transcriptional regulator [Agaribacterium sp. ZY112]|uniref:LysR family transcriptional regulator n=1 Tax=Agaribacterium sp. ZY112 TaxID=3233574 RepID=UPI00352529C1
MDKLEAIRVFIEVAKQKSFVAASQHLAMSAPAVTRAIAQLEQGLGVSLLNRTTRNVRLSDAGLRFLTDAKRIVEDLEEAEAAAAGVYAEPKGMLTVTSPVLFGEKHVMPIITEYLTLYPEMSVRAMNYDRITHLLEEEMHIAIRIGHLKDSNLYATQVGQILRLHCASPTYLKKHTPPKQPSDLQQHQIIFSTSPDSTPIWRFNNKGKTEHIKLSPRLYCNQIGASISAALQGHGIVRALSYQVSEHLQQGDLKTVLDEFQEAPLPVNVVRIEGKRSNAKIRSFLDLAISRLQENKIINP